MVDKKCKKDALYLNMQKAYCKFLHSSYDYAESILEFIMSQKKLKNKKCCIVLDQDATIQSEDDRTNYETFTRAINFIKSTKDKYKDKITIVIITARTSKQGLKKFYKQNGVGECIEMIMYDIDDIGTLDSKIQNRQLLRDEGYTIIMSIGDNHTDMVPDLETSGSSTANILLSNLYRLDFD